MSALQERVRQAMHPQERAYTNGHSVDRYHQLSVGLARAERRLTWIMVVLVAMLGVLVWHSLGS